MKQTGLSTSIRWDGKGNVEILIDSAQAVVATYHCAPFEKLLAKIGSLT
jgi:hypothetical protein